MANLVQIKEYLQEQKLPYDVIDLGDEAFTVDDVVKSGIRLDEVVKTLVVRISGSPSTRSGTSGRAGSGYQSFIALALRGSDKLDFKKIRSMFGSKSELAKPDEVLEVVGVPVGAVCPILIGIPLYLDKNVMDLKNVHMGSGDLKKGLEMKLANLLKACGDYRVEYLAI